MGEEVLPERNLLARQDASVTDFRSRSPLAKTGRWEILFIRMAVDLWSFPCHKVR